MEKQFADEKMKKYLRLMRLRRNFVLSVFLVPSVVIVVLMLARVDEKYLSIYFPIVMIPIILFLMFKLLANDICPWCKYGFFMNDLGSFVNGLSFIFRKQCSHCGQPDKLSKNVDVHDS
ncbi:hypothetical protein SOI76_11690 [Acinetobacter pittii]|uniref:hypothetical protein n=1 Tax=Acinetobacter pittii TaxID=48296 RepID=UPI000CE3185D|nr:hypothetical protein [Acinetobacter pittii]PPC04403.1 hypothetical protein ApiMCR8900_13745 [Acinetobacter pittii]WPP58102.1 hypothetical protein SOI76_11690 [Acinetobacter pittii]